MEFKHAFNAIYFLYFGKREVLAICRHSSNRISFSDQKKFIRSFLRIFFFFANYVNSSRRKTNLDAKQEIYYRCQGFV